VLADRMYHRSHFSRPESAELVVGWIEQLRRMWISIL
jgi:hypothetical protein